MSAADKVLTCLFPAAHLSPGPVDEQAARQREESDVGRWRGRGPGVLAIRGGLRVDETRDTCVGTDDGQLCTCGGARRGGAGDRLGWMLERCVDGDEKKERTRGRGIEWDVKGGNGGVKRW